MIEQSFQQAAVIASYFWEFIELPSHAERLGRLRVLRRRAEDELRLTAAEELARLRVVAASAEAWDAELCDHLGLGQQSSGATTTTHQTPRGPKR